MEDAAWPADWMRAVLPLAVLGVLKRGDTHGYALRQLLRAEGLDNVTGSTLYPLLSRQQELGRLGFRWEHDASGPARKIFYLTDAGREALSELTIEWQRLTAVVNNIVPLDPTGVKHELLS